MKIAFQFISWKVCKRILYASMLFEDVDESLWENIPQLKNLDNE